MTLKLQLPQSDILALSVAVICLAVFLILGQPMLAATGRLWVALAITAAFALVGWFARGVDFGGAVAGSVIAFILAAREIKMFLVLLAVFAITLVVTRIGSNRKRQQRTAERADGRSASQVMANLGVAGLIAALAPGAWLVLSLAALAEAAADTSSSEIGVAFPGRTILITSWKRVRAGVDGGISLHGTAAALAAAAAIAFAGRLFGLVSAYEAGVVVCSAFLGMLIDSLLGAALERHGWLTNDLVNLLSTAAAVGIARLLV